MLDLDPSAFREGQPLPRGWQFIVLVGETRRSALRPDGYPGLGLPLPDLGLPRVVLGGRIVNYNDDIPIGAAVHRLSCLRSVERKKTTAGPAAIVTIEHELRIASALPPSVVEAQTYVLLSDQRAEERAVPAKRIQAEHRKIVVPDATLLFQYSALGFNSHKIHIDRDYARDVEGLPDLVVNGGLTTLLMTEFLRSELRHVPTRIKTRHVAPLYCGRPITLVANRDGGGWWLSAFDDTGRIATEMEVHVQ
jgi:3-methylfumaryl-CoA hydratase